MRLHLATGLLTGLTIGPLAAASVAAIPVQTNVAVSVNDAGEFAAGVCTAARISGNGRYVVFQTRAQNLAPGLSGNFDFIFRRDLETQETVVVSVALDGTPADRSFLPDISDDGRYVAFTSVRSDLVAGDTNDHKDIFVRDMVTGTTELISAYPGGTPAERESDRPRISGDGRYVTFDSYSRFDPRDLNNNPDIYRRDRASGALEYVSVTQAGVGSDSWSIESGISRDGRFIVFRSRAQNFGSSTPTTANIFRKDMQTGELLQVDRPSTVDPGNFGSGWPSISGNGQVVAYVSRLYDLVAGPNTGQWHVYAYDAATGSTERLNLRPDGSTASGSFTSHTAVSFRGRFVTFSAQSDDLLPGPSSFAEEVFLRDRWSGTTERVSVGHQGGLINNYATDAHVDSDGHTVTFISTARNITPGPSPFTPQVYARDLREDIGTSYCAGVPNSTGATGEVAALGFTQVNRNEVTLQSTALPPSVLTFFLASLNEGFTPQPGGSVGNLCLGGSIGRYVRPGEVSTTGPDGTASLSIHLTDVPQPVGSIVIQPGDSLHFQGWHRDVAAGTATSNFTVGLRIDFQ